MGFLVLLGMAAAFVFVAAPAIAFGLSVVHSTAGERGFWLPCALSGIAAFVLQFAYASAPALLHARAVTWDLLLAPLFGWHLLAPPAAAVLLWLRVRMSPSPALGGVVAGLFFSVAGMVVAPVPLTLLLAPFLGLEMQP